MYHYTPFTKKMPHFSKSCSIIIGNIVDSILRTLAFSDILFTAANKTITDINEIDRNNSDSDTSTLLDERIIDRLEGMKTDYEKDKLDSLQENFPIFFRKSNRPMVFMKRRDSICKKLRS